MVGISPINKDALTQMFTRLMIMFSIGISSLLMDMAKLEASLGTMKKAAPFLELDRPGLNLLSRLLRHRK